MIKNKYFITMLFVSMAIAAVVLTSVSCNTNAEAKGINKSQTENMFAIPALFEREGKLAQTTEWQKTKQKVAELIQKVAANSGDVKSRLQIATIYMTEARITGQRGYYDPAIYKMLDAVLALDSKNFEAYIYKASVKMSQHQFAEGKLLAEKAKSINPDNAYVYGMLTDANVELGNYQDAISMSDKMQSLKPSLEAYSRVSYLREIFGDYAGAKEAMKMALAAGIPGSESGEWTRVALADLYLNTGELDSAEMQYKTSLEVRLDFPNAEIGIAKIEKARKNYDSAIAHTEAAIRIVSEAPYVSLLAELYLLKGDKNKAAEINNDVVELLEKAEKEQSNSTSKHNGNKELATAYLNANKLDKAMEYAQNDLKLRPENIDANELVAWIAYLKNDKALAKSCADKMLATHTMNAATLHKAALIYKQAGDIAKSESLMAISATVSKYIDEKIIMVAK